MPFQTKPPPASHANMGHAIGLAVIIVVLGVFMPAVLGALEDFLLTFFGRATALLQTIEPQGTAHIIQTLRQ